MRANILIRDLPNGEIEVKCRTHGQRRPKGEGTEALVNSILTACAAEKRIRKTLKKASPEELGKMLEGVLPAVNDPLPPVAEASH